MAELNLIEREVIKTMADLGATKDASAKTAADIIKKSNRPRGLVANALASLAQKKVVQRVVKEKSAMYYTLKA